MTYADYVIKIHFYVKKRDEAVQLSWEQTRYVAFCVVATQTNKIRSPRQLMPFPWEKEDIKKEHRRAMRAQNTALKNYDTYLRYLKKFENAKSSGS